MPFILVDLPLFVDRIKFKEKYVVEIRGLKGKGVIEVECRAKFSGLTCWDEGEGWEG
jgi:hypothetical protein